MLSPLIVTIPELSRLQGGTVLYKVPDTLTVVAFHVTAVVPVCLHSNAAAYQRFVIERTRKVVNVKRLYYVSDVVQFKVSLHVAGVSDILVFGGKG